MEAEFVKSLLLAAQGISAAQAKLDEYQKKNPRAYLQLLAKILADDTKPDEARITAALSWKNLFDIKESAKLREQRAKQWLSLAPEFRTNLKKCAMMALHSPTKEIYRAAAQVIAKVAHIELPAQQWPELVKILLAQIKAQDKPPALKIATLTCLEYICDGIASLDVAYLNDILNALTQGMRREVNDFQVNWAAANAFEKCLELISEPMSKERDRNYIMKVVCDACSIDHPKVREQALRVLGRMASLYYEHFPRYIKHIFTITTGIIPKASPVVAMQAIEFWCTLCEEEFDRLDREPDEEDPCLNIIKNIQGDLVPHVLNALVHTEFSDDSDECDLPAAAGILLGLMANVVGNPIIEKVWAWVKAHLKGDSPFHREAAAMAFGAILDGPTTQALEVSINQILVVLVAHLSSDKVPQVRETVVWVLSRIAEFHPALICDNKAKLERVLHSISKSLTDTPEVASLGCLALHNIAISNPDSGKDDSCLSPFFQQVISLLLRATERQDIEGTDLASSAFEAIVVWISNSSQKTIPLVKSLCDNFIKRLKTSFSVSTHTSSDVELRLQQQGHICAVLLVIVQKLEGLVKPYARSMIDLYVQIFKSSGGSAYVHEDALMAVGSVATALENDFLPFVDEVMPYITKGLSAVQQHAVCTASVGALSDIARAIGPNFARLNCDNIMHLLTAAAKNQALHRSVKPHILAAFGDIANAINDKFTRYLSTVAQILVWAAKTPKRPDDEDFCLYVDNLREGILDGYTGILQGLRNGPHPQGDAFRPFITDLVNLVDLVWSDRDRTAAAELAVVGVIGDLATTVGKPAAASLKRPSILAILQQSSRHDDTEMREMAAWSREQLQSL